MAFNKEALIKRLDTLGFPQTEVALTFEEFFDKNDCETSIGVNISYKPSISEFRNTFKKLLDEKIADNVFVRIVDVEDPEEWIFSDTVYIIGDIHIDELENRIKNLSPDEITEGWIYGKPVNIDKYDKSKNVYTIFWD